MLSPTHAVVRDGVVGSWHRWAAISVAATTLYTYFWMIVAYAVLRWLQLGQAYQFNLPSPLDPRVLLLTIPWGVLAGERGYQRDLLANGPRPTPAPGLTKDH